MKGPFSAWSFLASTCGQIRFYSLMNCTYRGNSLASLIHSPSWNLQEQAARTSIWHWVREFHLPKPDLFANVSLEIGHQNWWIPSCVAGARVILCAAQHFVPEPEGCVRCTTSVAAAPPFCPSKGWGCVGVIKICAVSSHQVLLEQLRKCKKGWVC